MVLYDTLYNDDMIDTSFHDQITIGIGGTCTVVAKGKTYDLVSSSINYHTRILSGKDLTEINLGFEEYHVKSTTINLEDITEIIFEGFIITADNRDNILKLIHEDGINFTKIPKRN